MKFEYDEKKSESNKIKHGIDFEEVQELWNDSLRIEIRAKLVDEIRYILLGKIDKKIWAVVITYRGEVVRIISARRARKEEVMIYES